MIEIVFVQEVTGFADPADPAQLFHTNPDDSDKKTLAEECLDDLPAVSQFHAVLIDPNSTIEQVRHALMETFEEINENYSKWCDERGVEP